MQKAIFFDRDGILNKEIGDYVTCVEDFEILEDKLPYLQKWKGEGYVFFIITNQGGIAKGMYSHEILSQIHQKLIDFYRNYGIEFLEIFYCPHHPITSNCLCRKPDSLMMEKSVNRYNIDITKSYMIGDKERDVLCAEAVGVKGFLLESNENFERLPF